MNAPEPFHWPKKSTCALSFAYVGGDSQQADLALPLLDQLELRGSFFLEPTVAIERLPSWITASERGHELQNGCLTGFSDAGRLLNWSRRALTSEIQEGENFLSSVSVGPYDGFFLPGSVTLDADGDYLGVIENRFRYSCSYDHGLNDLGANLISLKTVAADHFPLHEIGDVMMQQQLSWIILRFDPWGEEGVVSQAIVHRLILESVRQLGAKIWIAPVGEVASELALLQARTHQQTFLS